MPPELHSRPDAAKSPLLVATSDDGRIATLILNRPERLNALGSELLACLAETIESLSRDDGVRVVILAAAGDAFCSGADTEELAGGVRRGPHALGPEGPEGLRRGFEPAQRIILGLQRMPKPVIAAINGPAVGAGFDLACACDIRVGTPAARFMAAYVKVGLFPGYGGTWLYPRLLGMGVAAELLFTGDFLEASDAHRLGLLNRLVAPGELMDVAQKMARRIADGPPIAIRLAKLLLYKGLELDLETAMQVAAAAETVTLSSKDHLEGLAALREKRRPKFGGT
ncbi:MAG: enoyl-CoA hydratase [SAR202 cluster bacterium]|nr:enoyl-CoA hydratase [SAR202 cluster bacterium]